MSDRIRNELGYKHVMPFPIRDSHADGGELKYFMIHASDHEAAPVLMARAFRRVAKMTDDLHVQVDLAWSDEDLALVQAHVRPPV